MARRARPKPYDEVIRRYPKYEEEIKLLPRSFLAVISSYEIREIIGNDAWHEVIAGCYEAQERAGRAGFFDMARQIIHSELKRMRKENNISYRALRLDRCYGDSKRPMIDWLCILKDKEQEEGS